MQGRTQAVLARERAFYPGMVVVLEGRAKANPAGAEDRLTVDLLQAGLESRTGLGLSAAAFLAGRCRPPDEAAARVSKSCAGLLDRLADQVARSRGLAFVEAAMSVALDGDLQRGHAALGPLVADGGAATPHAYLAAAYLAEMGDPVGWPALRAALGDPVDPVLRLQAARELLPFMPYAGTTVDGEVIDVGAELRDRLADEDPHVATGIPTLIVEARPEGGREALEQAVVSAGSEAVRAAAASALERMADPGRPRS